VAETTASATPSDCQQQISVRFGSVGFGHFRQFDRNIRQLVDRVRLFPTIVGTIATIGSASKNRGRAAAKNTLKIFTLRKAPMTELLRESSMRQIGVYAYCDTH
jgi:hypothetical protein